MDYIRNGIRHHAEVTPHFCADSQSYRIGLYVRDNTAGVGTLTFWEPESGTYGALGHPVTSLHSELNNVQNGTIIRASIEGIRIGTAGSPIIQDEKLIGAITHVFINDPTQGYACYAQQMLEEVGLLQE